jgi:CheY-like chemotaxis protein
MEQLMPARPGHDEVQDEEGAGGEVPDDARITDRLTAEDRRARRVAFVIDDSEDAQELFGQALASAGFRVVPALDGRQALDLLLDHPVPTVVILDLIMPRLTGFELLDVLSSYSRLQQVPIVVVTASCDEVQLNLPFAKCLRKPIDGNALVEEVEALLALKGAVHARHKSRPR